MRFYDTPNMLIIRCNVLQDIPDDDREQFNQKQIIVSGKHGNLWLKSKLVQCTQTNSNFTPFLEYVVQVIGDGLTDFHMLKMLWSSMYPCDGVSMMICYPSSRSPWMQTCKRASDSATMTMPQFWSLVVHSLYLVFACDLLLMWFWLWYLGLR